MKTTDQLYEELRAVIDDGNESMTHEDALAHVRSLQQECGRVRPYTVLVLRPDYAATNYGQDTFLSHVNATSPLQAQQIARREAAEADRSEQPSEDYYILLTLEGLHYDMRVEG
ncbi:hypothetical protein DBR23_23480 [Acidovorax sp. HMWF018]|uniref:hypothetical protein n=1 Tax=Acidovorax sp. HMWF018 TaxID=2056855 RepID=UPI000D3CED27|nr:hypothetical protein [Acidovorax sp. HMWF018]PTT35469.1 hypothetical protein DBR23_23480 [Acidovorax sp. HMWF018]